MDILIVSGFLGAGKTTFIKALSKKTGKEFAILENEYSDLGVDGERLHYKYLGTDGGMHMLFYKTGFCTVGFNHCKYYFS